ncbi:hypothetical protein DPMN_053870 [Dreissena polymorpha]|uniref:Uncharacterized protein n=1 Tax=Dreissena polymorpha TaxID=45954 RepID=A0A9D4CM74_DREPO|nr:hypothetical protein DPMN_053870 [Dreissena polymorpha]
MTERGMGLKPDEFLDFTQRVACEEKVTHFKNDHPSQDWYRAFVAKNFHIIQLSKETSLETLRVRLSKPNVDKCYLNFRDFVVNLRLDDKQCRIFNADETGFSLRS